MPCDRALDSVQEIEQALAGAEAADGAPSEADDWNQAAWQENLAAPYP